MGGLSRSEGKEDVNEAVSTRNHRFDLSKPDASILSGYGTDSEILQRILQVAPCSQSMLRAPFIAAWCCKIDPVVRSGEIDVHL